MDIIEKLLIDLHESIAQEENNEVSSTDIESYVQLIGSIESIALNLTNEKEIQLTATLLFFSQNNPPNLLLFAKSTARSKDKDIIRSKVNAMKFLLTFIKKFQFVCFDRMPRKQQNQIITFLIDVFKREESGEVKAALLLPVKTLLRMQWKNSLEKSSSVDAPTVDEPTSSNEDELNNGQNNGAAAVVVNTLPLDMIYTALLDEIKYNKKISKGTLSESLKVLGLIVINYPADEVTLTHIDTILNLVYTNLQSNFASKRGNNKDPDFPVIAGCFSCLDYLLDHFEDRFVNNVDIWKYLLQAVQSASSEDVHRYSAAGKALRVIKKHAELFQELIGFNSLSSYEILLTCHQTKKQAILKHSSEALQAVIAQIASFLVKHRMLLDPQQHQQQQQQNNNLLAAVQSASKTVQQLLTTFTSKLVQSSVGTGSESELIDGIEGLIAISPAAVALPPLVGQHSIESIVESVVTTADHYCRYYRNRNLYSTERQTVTAEEVKYDLDGEEQTGSGQSQHTVEEGGESAGAGQNLRFQQLSNFLTYRKSLFLCCVVSYLYTAAQEVSTSRRTLYQLLEKERVLLFLEEYTTDAILGFIRLWKKQQKIIYAAMTRLLAISYLLTNNTNVTKNNNTIANDRAPQEQLIILQVNGLFWSTLKTIFLRTISRRETGESVSPDAVRVSEYTHELDDRLVFNYLPLWRELFHPTDKNFHRSLVEFFDVQIVTEMRQFLLEKLIALVIESMSSLDLSYRHTEEFLDTDDLQDSLVELPISQQQSRMIPMNLIDQDVLIQLTCFIEEGVCIQPTFGASMMMVTADEILEYLPAVLERVVEYARVYPLISAFYRLVTCFMRFCAPVIDKEILYYNENQPSVDTPGVRRLQESMREVHDLVVFIEEEIQGTSSHHNQYHGELLNAILQMILTMPIELFTFREILPAIKLSITSGLQLSNAVNMMSKYYTEEKEAVEPYLDEILPILEKYLTLPVQDE